MALKRKITARDVEDSEPQYRKLVQCNVDPEEMARIERVRGRLSDQYGRRIARASVLRLSIAVALAYLDWRDRAEEDRTPLASVLEGAIEELRGPKQEG